ncbi:MAG: iron-containing alcohol dehydrogenase [Traorella sp.]
MNQVEKIYCRVVQFCFHLAIPFLPYHEPHILTNLQELIPILKQNQIHSILFVTDSYLRNNGNTTSIEHLLKQNSIHCTIYDKTNPNPTVTNVTEGKQRYLDENCQAIITFGGGSSIDCGKAIGACIVYPHRNVNELRGLLKVWRKLPLLIAIPTTAGTGSEVTISAVISDTEKKEKYTMNNFTMIPSYALLDPTFTYTLPPHLTATTGMDALCHAVEAYIGNSTTKYTRKLSLEVTKLIFGNIEIAYHKPTNYLARSNMLLASYKAGIAFSISYVGYIHAISHSLSGQYGIPHGFANAVIMPVILDDYGEVVYNKLHDLGVAANVTSSSDSHEEGAKKFIQAILDLNKRMNIPETIAGIEKKDISIMAKRAAKEANPLYPVPKLMDAYELEKIYYQIADWS